MRGETDIASDVTQTFLSVIIPEQTAMSVSRLVSLSLSLAAGVTPTPCAARLLLPIPLRAGAVGTQHVLDHFGNGPALGRNTGSGIHIDRLALGQ